MFRPALLALSAALVLGAPAQAQNEAIALVEQTASAALSSQNANTDALLSSIDFEAVARFTLGKHSRSLAPAELERFQTALRTLIGETYDRHLDSFKGADVTIIGDKPRNEKDTIVETRVTRSNGDTLRVNWRLLNRTGEWRVVDVEVEGIWLAIEQRAQFAAILDRPGANIDTLITTIEETRSRGTSAKV